MTENNLNTRTSVNQIPHGKPLTLPSGAPLLTRENIRDIAQQLKRLKGKAGHVSVRDLDGIIVEFPTEAGRPFLNQPDSEPFMYTFLTFYSLPIIQVLILRLLPGTKCPHPRPNSGRRYSHVDSAKSYSAQPRLTMLTIAPPQLTLAHGHLKLNHGRSRSNLAASGCSCCRSVSHSRSRFWAPRHLSSHAVCDEKNVKSTRPYRGSQFRDPFIERLEVIHRRRLANAIG